MARRSLRPELNRIRAWVHQGRTDAWIAHQLDVTVQQIQGFKRDQSLEATEEASDGGVAVVAVAGEDADAAVPAARWRQASITVKRVTACGSTRPFRMIPCTRSTGPAIARSR